MISEPTLLTRQFDGERLLHRSCSKMALTTVALYGSLLVFGRTLLGKTSLMRFLNRSESSGVAIRDSRIEVRAWIMSSSSPARQSLAARNDVSEPQTPRHAAALKFIYKTRQTKDDLCSTGAA